MSDAAQTFNEAYDLIEQGNLTAARQLLNDVRAENLNNPHFWWLYSHAVDDEREGRAALQRVKELQPDYPGIDNLIQQANIGAPAPRPIQTIRPPQTLPDLPKTQGVDDDFDMDDDDLALDNRPQGNMRRNLLITSAIIIVVVILGAFLLPNLLGGGAQPTSTPIAQPVTTLGTIEIIDTTEDVTAAPDEPTATEEEAVETEQATATEEEAEVSEEPTATEEESATATEAAEPTEDITPTEEVTETIEVAGNDFADLAAQLADFDVPADGVEVGETLLGNTLLVTTCSAPGPSTTEAILGIANALKAETLSDDIEAVGFSITNCADNSVLRIIGVSRGDFDEFVADNITVQQLQGLLRPIG